jgi:hypothetical protein
MPLLDDIVDERRGIDAAFVSDLSSGFPLESSTTPNGRDPKLINALIGTGSGGPAFAQMGVFQAIQRMMDRFGQETGHGDLNSTILQFGGDNETYKGILVVYVCRLKKMSLAIGFVNTKQTGDSLASMVFFCESHIKDILAEVEQKYGP